MQDKIEFEGGVLMGQMNKKGAALVAFLGLVMYIGGIAMVFYYSSNAMDVSTSFGAPQRELLESYADGEALRQYVIQSAKYASHQALFSMAANGGFGSTEAECESVGGYRYWYNDGKICLPDMSQTKTLFEVLFLDYFNNYLMKYDDLTIGENLVSLYDAVDYQFNINTDTGVIEGVPLIETYELPVTNEAGEITGTELYNEESIMWFRKTVEDPEGIRPTVTFDYYVNPYFVYAMPFAPVKVLNDVRAQASKGLTGIGECGDDIATKATSLQTSLNSDVAYSWKVSGQKTENACVVKFDVSPKGVVVYGEDPNGDVFSELWFRFAVKYTGSAPNL